MRIVFRLASLSCFGTMLAVAANWSGALVDSECYAAKLRSVNGRENAHVSSDKGRSVRYCAPDARTKSFAIVQRDGEHFDLNPDGNEKATHLLSTAGKKYQYIVNVTGEITGQTIQVETIAMAK